MVCNSVLSGVRSLREDRIRMYARTLLRVVGIPPRLASRGFRATSDLNWSKNLEIFFSMESSKNAKYRSLTVVLDTFVTLR